MNYVMSDVHGDYIRYIQMLEKIKLKEDDTLYILGDVIDRGEGGIKILQDMMLRPNVIPILGNHEYMASISLSWLLKEITEENIQNIGNQFFIGLREWLSVGGEATIKEFYKLSIEEREDIMDYLSEFQLYDVVEVNGKTFVFVHAGLEHFSIERNLNDYDLSEVLFHHPDYDKVYFEDTFLVTGHTLTRMLHAHKQGLLLEDISKEQYKDTIFKENNHIAIDCGCGYDGKLACLCLDTMEEYYV